MKNNNSTNSVETEKFAPGPVDFFNFWENPLTFFTNVVKEHGDLVCLDPDKHQIYLLNNPDDIKHVLQDNYHNYKNDSDAFKLVIGNGLAASEGELWLRQRRIMQPAFHHRNLETMGDSITNITMRFMQNLQISTNKNIDALAEITELTTNISASTMFGADIQNETKLLSQALNTAQEYVYYHGWDFDEKFQKEPSLEDAQFQEALSTIDRIVYRIINERQKDNRQNKNDLLAMLLQSFDEKTGERMSEKQLRDEVVTMLAGGQSTTAIALVWILYILSIHPDAENRLYEEIIQVVGQRHPTFQDLPNLVYTRMIINEVLRLYPPSWLTTRRSIEKDQIGGYHIPKNSQILISSYLVHRHPNFWENPERFDPERFSASRSTERPHFAYIPFSGGARICIGNRFAIMVIELVLVMIVQTYRLVLPSKQSVQPEPHILLEPKDRLLIQIQKR